MCFIKAPKIDAPKIPSILPPPALQAPVVNGSRATDNYLNASGLRLGRSNQQSLRVPRSGLQMPGQQ